MILALALVAIPIAIALAFALAILAALKTPPHKADPVPPRRRVRTRQRHSMNVVGESFFQDNLASICGPKDREGVRLELVAELHREPENPHDPNAVAVRIKGLTVGYLTRHKAALLTRRMEAAGEPGPVQAAALIVGGWREIEGDDGPDLEHGDAVNEGHYGVKLDPTFMALAGSSH